jgi:gas vesicle protein
MANQKDLRLQLLEKAFSTFMKSVMREKKTQEKLINKRRDEIEDRISALADSVAHEKERQEKLINKRRHEAEKKLAQVADTVVHETKTQEKLINKRRHEAEKAFSSIVESVTHRQEKLDKQRDEQEVKPFLFGAVLGGLLGVVAAIWFAPQSGRKTRHEIQTKSQELVEGIEHVAEDARQKIEGESINDSIAEGKAEARRYQENRVGVRY